jgi:TonB-dependent starch-binding outer membrane protein SusC
MKLLKLHVFLIVCTLSFTPTFSQENTITGKVSDEVGIPLPGVTISVGQTSKTVTDFDGSYTIKVSANETLTYSFVGFKTVTEIINGRKIINVKLYENIKGLNEIIVVGYGTQKKIVVTGSISSVKARDLEKVPNGRIEQALQGRVSGVTVASNSGQPGSGSTIRIRGVTTFNNYGSDVGNNPLWVVDGVIIGSAGIGYLNQSDIESIEVLKDATSAAIYGTRGAPGVILVTTKKGTKGKISANYVGFGGVSSPAKKLKLLNATEYATLVNEREVAGGGSPRYLNPSALGIGTDWQKAIFSNNAQRYSHDVSFSGSNDISSFYVSFGIQDQEGIVAKDISHFNKKNIRLNSTHKLSKYITFGQTLGYTRQVSSGIGDNNREFGGPLSSALNLDPITPLVVTDPFITNASPYSNNPVIRDENGNPYGISSIVGQEMTNPLAYIKTRLGNYGWSDDFVGNAFIELMPFKDLKFKSSFGAKLAYFGGEGFTPKYYLNASTLTAKNSFGKDSNNAFDWNIENTLLYTKKFKEHNFSLLLGQGAYVEGHGGGSGVTIFGLPIDNYYDASFNFNIAATDRFSKVYTFNDHKLNSLFSRLTYDYNEKYLLTGIVRKDGSSRFGLNKKFGIFPSFSLGWVVSKEGFWKDNNIINLLKFRGGYGKVGNDAIGDFGYAAVIDGGYTSPFGFGGNIVTGYAPKTIENPDLRWEETSQTDFGVETRLFDNISLTFEYYKKKTKGILRPVRVPGYVGVSTNPYGNVADMENSGLELELSYRKKIGEINFSASGNFATLKNVVTYIGNDKFIGGDAIFQNLKEITRTEVGQAYNTFYGFKTAGIFQNFAEINSYTNIAGTLIQPNAKPGDFRWVDNDGDGKITDNDRTFLGSSIPKYTYGLTLNVDYKGFDLMMFAQGAGGNKIFQGLRRLDISNANYQTVALSRWTGEGTSNTFPRLTSNDSNENFGRMSDFYLEKGDYVRLKLVQIGYSLPSLLMSKIKLQKIRFYLTGENLYTFTKYTGYDPEVGGGVFGVDKGFYPQAKTVIFGTNIQF